MKIKPFIQFGVFLFLLCFVGGCADRMPYGFNGTVSRYPDSRIVNSMHLEGGCYAELETNDSWEKVLDYYKYHMSKKGWSVRVERESALFNSDDSETVAFLALFKDNTGLMIDTHTPVNGGKTQIALFMGDTDE
ncbi:MAG: hypothetical protein JRF31_05075 [Deltaproteobacteria bacterium]|mgnify:CR=1 FL=1|nr:hypothetical protein [Deltaproteobacteria bacterium]MBW1957369.1 hypothetical protein [Deltaproteobacteria bacterium]MBW2013008.1 hypothetical protein [Deltaproteobacteria bacterium]MBW2320219.1 hypothetical protein [Deltaproteobacteria bacterium]